ncbi:MAG TPA: MFS transporter [Nocardioidaceae bacterium]|nr:MFS transporter [Nocardioidaceae bacterium]
MPTESTESVESTAADPGAISAPTAPEVTTGRRERALILLGIVVLAFNLRPAATAVGPVLGDLQDALDVSATTAGVITTLPVLAFAVFGSLAPWCARTLGIHRVMLVALVLAAVGQFARAEAGSAAVFIAASVPALAGMATANVLLPSLIKLHFPTQIGRLTAVYTTTLAVGMTIASASTVPLAEAGGSWRFGIAAWGATAAIAALPWLLLLRHDVRPEERSGHAIGFRDVARTRVGWLMALFFGIQSLVAYAIFGWLAEIFRDAGFSAREAGLLLALTMALGIPTSLAVPGLATRRESQAPIVLTLAACSITGFVGLLAWPYGGAVVWATLLGIGTGMFPLALVLIALRTDTADGTAALSGFTQSVGYLIAGIGPFTVGLLYDATGSWTPPLALLAVLVVPQAAFGLALSRPRTLERELGLRQDPTSSTS